mmetsp:Transcript_536/g.1424  ORF Transcript_536/g.1424 Transcript_536/m.1424 type:complete len:318 (+) Transcript_536:2218-3171(+)
MTLVTDKLTGMNKGESLVRRGHGTLCHDVLHQVRRHHVVLAEVHLVAGASLGHTPQVRHVVEHLAQRHLGVDQLQAPRAIGELGNHAPSAVQISDDVAQVVLGRDDRHVHDRLQQLRAALRHGLAERLAGGDLERQDARIDVVVAAVDQRGLDVHNRESGQGSGAHHVLETLENTRNIFLRHNTSLDLGDELEATARLTRLEANRHVAKLPGSSTLLLVDVPHLGTLRDSLTVVDLRGARVALDLELPLQAIDDDLEMQLAHALDDGLVRLLIPGEVEGWVLLRQLDETVRHLVQVRFALGLQGNLDDWIRELHALE